MRAAAEAFEAVFLRQVIGSMRQARLAEDPLSSAATEQFRDLSDAQLADNCQAWKLLPDGSYEKLSPGDEPPISAQTVFLQQMSASA